MAELPTWQERAGDRRARPHVVIVGGGFGGLEAARALAHEPVRVTLVDRSNHHTFQPLLYQVATGGLSPADIAAPIRAVLSDQENVDVLLGEVRSVDLAARRIALQDREIPYDALILAAGVVNNWFGHGSWESLAPGLKTLEDATNIRRRILVAFEEAERGMSDAEREAWLTFVVVGGGPTGVEMAGAIAELSRNTLASDFRRIKPGSARVLLLEGSPRLLGAFAPQLGDRAAGSLRRLGVDVRLSTFVKEIHPHGVEIEGGLIPSRTVVWAAGVGGNPLAKTLGVPLARGGRVDVGRDLSIPGHPEVFVVGDMARAVQEDGTEIPGMAQGAIQGGRLAARNALRVLGGEETAPFEYVDKGMMATIGRAAAVVDLGPIKLSGLVAWLAWLTVHLYFLIGFRNRFVVLFQWAWAYFTHQRGARLITHLDWTQLSAPSAEEAPTRPTPTGSD